MEKVDKVLLTISISLISLGLLILYSASAPFSQINFGNTFYYFSHQILFGILPGVIIGLIILKINFRRFKKMTPWFLFLNLILLTLVFIPPFGIKSGGGSRWIGFANFSFQPSELLKLTFILYLSSWLASRVKKEDRNFRQTFFFFLLIIVFISTFLILQPDFSTLGIIFTISISLFFLAKTPIWQTFLIVLIAALFFLPLAQIAPYRMKRILSFLNPEFDPLGISYHIKQAEIAIGSGGVFGKGLGLSTQKLGVLPHVFSDSIFAILAEELGFLGALFLILFYLLFFWRIYQIGTSQKDLFSKLVCFGILSWISSQTFVNISSMIGILPLTGIPLPFVSYGGSHMLTEIASLFVLFKLSKQK
jgi:cell division protein FtsW